jgi:hypothetical protein
MFRLAPIVLAGLVAAGAASAAGPGMGTTQSVLSHDGKLMYEADAQKGRTTVDILRAAQRLETVHLRGMYGFPLPTNDVSGEGLSHDGRTLVLAEGRPGGFAVLDARTLQVRRRIKLNGVFTYDALSPNAAMLYLIQHQASGGEDHYYVRAYDVRAGRLVKQIVFDAREKGGLMTGWAVARATGPSGRWVYTLYSHSNGTFFVHSLDTVDRHAFCVDLPGRVSPQAVQTMRLKLSPGKLVVMKGSTRFAVIDTKKLRVTRG